MRKLKLQVQITLDGFVAGPQGQLDWMWIPGEPDRSSFEPVIELAATSDTILMGRKMTREFVDYWENVADNQPNSPEHSFALQMVNLRKIVFSHTEKEIEGRNVEVENGDLVTAVKALKTQPGKDLLVYGGASFVSSLIEENLIDEYYLFVTPVAIGEGLRIFKEKKILKLEKCVVFRNGKMMQKYLPA
ncbi:dihydrofolate reductase family protein [Nostoc ellipsosporum NOK]|nr:dihydrofolate reductase family protein [Nostoc ellipsosporum NOK]